MKEVVIVSACRTAIGTFGGTLRDVPAVNIAGASMKGAIEKAGIETDMIDDVRYGCCLEPYHAFNVSRISSLLAGVPESCNAVTINRACISGMEAVISGMAFIQSGLAEIILAGGIEHMSGTPYAVCDARWGVKIQGTTFDDVMMSKPVAEPVNCALVIEACTR